MADADAAALDAPPAELPRLSVHAPASTPPHLQRYPSYSPPPTPLLESSPPGGFDAQGGAPGAAQQARAASFSRLTLEEEYAETPRGTSSRVRRVRELYVGPMSWLWGVCVLGPLVLLCPCDGRDVWMQDCCGGELGEADADDDWDHPAGSIRMEPLLSRKGSAASVASADGAAPRGAVPDAQPTDTDAAANQQ